MVAKGFFTAEVGDMLGEIRLAPAILFYLIYVAGILVFVSGLMTASWQSTLLYGALFGFFCYATFELTSLSLLRHWTWPVVVLDVTWGSFVTALSSTAGQPGHTQDLNGSDVTQNETFPGCCAAGRFLRRGALLIRGP